MNMPVVVRNSRMDRPDKDRCQRSCSVKRRAHTVNNKSNSHLDNISKQSLVKYDEIINIVGGHDCERGLLASLLA